MDRSPEGWGIKRVKIVDLDARIDARIAAVGGTGNGEPGASAYEIAVTNGFSGTEVEWLASLVGADGQDGTDGLNGTNGTNGTDGADGADGEGLPAGAIIMWAGALASIPSGFALCDGQNGTPDLRDRFIKGAAADADPGATGGSSTHTHAAHTGVISHTHSVSVTDPGHSHVEQQNSATTGPLAGFAARDTSTNTPIASGYSTQSAQTGISASTANPAGSVASLGHDTPSHLPPFYALAFIQKL